MAIVASDYITSKDVEVFFQPNGHRAGADGADRPHIQHLYLDAAIDGGTFKLRVNGELTAAITYNATIATFLASINSALDALEVLGAGEIVASGAAQTDITLTSAGNGFYVIRAEAVAFTDGGSPVADATALRSAVTQGGAAMYRLDAFASAFSWEESVDTTDVTPISQFAADSIVTKSSATFDLQLFDANQEWLWIFSNMDSAELYGRLYVYKQGRVDGRRYHVFDVLVNKTSGDFPDHDKVEKSLTGERKGAWVVPPDSIYRLS